MKSAFHLLAVLAFTVLSAAGDGIPKLIAHRGASEDAPENTLAAFRLAWRQGADGIEADFLLSRDGEVVCIHDRTTKRTANKTLTVADSTLAELRTLDFGAWKSPDFKGEKIPTLAEVLDEIPPGKWFFLEIKDSPEIVVPIAAILSRKRHDREKLVLISFDKSVVKACRETMPEYKACLISSLKGFAENDAPERFLADLTKHAVPRD
jgi:glycerophosphoryl diester phosphodiesterase